MESPIHSFLQSWTCACVCVRAVGRSAGSGCREQAGHLRRVVTEDRKRGRTCSSRHFNEEQRGANPCPPGLAGRKHTGDRRRSAFDLRGRLALWPSDVRRQTA